MFIRPSSIPPKNLASSSPGRINTRKLKTGPQTILLVEDEENAARPGGDNSGKRRLPRSRRERRGWKPVAIFEEHRDDIGLAVCDLGLLRALGSVKFFFKMKESRPGVRAIAASGYLGLS